MNLGNARLRQISTKIIKLWLLHSSLWAWSCLSWCSSFEDSDTISLKLLKTFRKFLLSSLLICTSPSSSIFLWHNFTGSISVHSCLNQWRMDLYLSLTKVMEWWVQMELMSLESTSYCTNQPTFLVTCSLGSLYFWESSYFLSFYDFLTRNTIRRSLRFSKSIKKASIKSWWTWARLHWTINLSYSTSLTCKTQFKCREDSSKSPRFEKIQLNWLSQTFWTGFTTWWLLTSW